MNGMTTVRMYNFRIRKRPKLIREIGAEGYLNGARKTGDMLYFVTNVQPNFWIVKEIEGDLLRPARIRFEGRARFNALELYGYRNFTWCDGTIVLRHYGY